MHLSARKARLLELAQLSGLVSLRLSVFVSLQPETSQLLEEFFPDVFLGVSEKPPQQGLLPDSS